MREQAMVADADSEINADEVEDCCGDYGLPMEEEKRGDGSGVKDDHEDERSGVVGLVLCAAA
jgi:hypothetical protein